MEQLYISLVEPNHHLTSHVGDTLKLLDCTINCEKDVYDLYYRYAHGLSFSV